MPKVGETPKDEKREQLIQDLRNIQVRFWLLSRDIARILEELGHKPEKEEDIPF